MDRGLTLRAHAVEMIRRKVRVLCELGPGDDVYARGEIVAIAVSAGFLAQT